MHAGVDLMFAPGWSRHAVAEVNVFGDLLPGVLVDGRDTYGTELAAVFRDRVRTPVPREVPGGTAGRPVSGRTRRRSPVPPSGCRRPARRRSAT
ncbi:hypothetical protein JCM9534A_04610 [Catenuloplanes indicus JCM 9534]|uniref:Uncharacterized protein n=1 Tax=Catenuloplanes indicus TaxID=137267 RepID=A0AAE3VUC9_9ACTN|nr:hypothetical protein [Catenuloplanes indicus]